MKRADSEEELKEAHLEQEAVRSVLRTDQKENRALRSSSIPEGHLHAEDIPLPRSATPREDIASSANPGSLSFAEGEGDGDREDDASNAEPRSARKIKPSHSRSSIKSKPGPPTTFAHPPSIPTPPQAHHHGPGKLAPPLLSLDAGNEVALRLLYVAALHSPHPVHFNTAGHPADGDHPTPLSSTSSAFSSSSSRPHLADDDSFEGDTTLTHIQKPSFGSSPSLTSPPKSSMETAKPFSGGVGMGVGVVGMRSPSPTPRVPKLPAPFMDADPAAVSPAQSPAASASSSSQDSELEREEVEAELVKTVKKETKPLPPPDSDSDSDLVGGGEAGGPGPGVGVGGVGAGLSLRGGDGWDKEVVSPWAD
jgi:hypothetical protein